MAVGGVFLEDVAVAMLDIYEKHNCVPNKLEIQEISKIVTIPIPACCNIYICLAKIQKSIGQTNVRLFIRLTIFYLQATRGLVFILVEEIIYIIVSVTYAIYLEK